MFNRLIPLSLYIHFPWCVRKCPYCDFNSYTAPNKISEDAYIKALIADLDLDLPMVFGRSLVSIFIGGGTPSLFSPKSISCLLNEIEKRIEWEPNIEITMEANPTTFEQGKFADFKAAGINRLSIGVQSFQDDKLKALERTHSAQDAQRAIEKAFKAGFSNINLDLMHGLPNQSVEDAVYDLKTAFNYFTPHLSWYQLTVEPRTVFACCPPKLPQEDQLNDIQEKGCQLIKEHGLKNYEISAYSLPEFQCRHNINYWKFGDYLGIGAGAHGKITKSNFKIVRYEKIKNPQSYLKCAANLSPNFYRLDAESCSREILLTDLPLEFMMNALRFYEGVPKELFEERTGIGLDKIEPLLRKAEAQGLMECSPNRLKTTELGRRFLNQCLEIFMGFRQ